MSAAVRVLEPWQSGLPTREKAASMRCSSSIMGLDWFQSVPPSTSALDAVRLPTPTPTVIGAMSVAARVRLSRVPGLALKDP